MRLQVLRQHAANGALRLRISLGDCIHGQAGHVGGHGAAVFDFQNDRIRALSLDARVSQDSIAEPLGILLRDSEYEIE